MCSFFYTLANSVDLKEITYRTITKDPPHFVLDIMTRGGPLANISWSRNDELITNNEMFKMKLVVKNYTDAVYEHTLTVLADAPGVYKFSAINPFDTTLSLSRSRVVEGIISQ